MRLGFHGLAVQSVVEQIEAARVVVCHLGGGCSVTAVRDRRLVDNEHGLPRLEGPPMGTRSGSVDPGVVLHLLRSGIGIDELDRILNEESAAGPRRTRGRVRLPRRHIAKTVAAMAAVLGGVDVLAFSGGIGENRVDVREAVAARLRHLGGFRIAVVAAREDLVIAGAVLRGDAGRRCLCGAPKRPSAKSAGYYASSIGGCPDSLARAC